ncbi:MAG: glycoside hydrolase family 3 C-terminal domain-containing protein [Elusimicrobia bacterium]|nr:glycoside hydrolase family 3 C-terminal domain-containing protein [Elusimicrobiota bacterium]
MVCIRRFVKFFAVILAGCIFFVSPAVAKLKPITSEEVMSAESSSESGGNAALNAMDENYETRWESSHKVDPAWLKINLKKKKEISSIKIVWEAASAKVYEIQVSKDGSDWKNVATVNDGAEGEERIIKFEPVKTKYVRIYGKERTTKWGYSIWEIIFNPEEEPEPPVLDIRNLPYMDPGLPIEKRVESLLGYMTFKEKVAELAGKDVMDGKTNKRLGIPPLLMCDGPHGIRMYGRATCFPSLIISAGWDEDLMRRAGVAIGREARAKGRNLVLGPCINIHRTPLGGRNFESLSEDPYLAGRMAVAYVNGVQSEKIGTSVKHFACNNQEWDRDKVSVEISERALREIYLPAFKSAVVESQATSIMGAYNKIGGDYCCENYHLLTDILKNDWGFKGFVVSDWGALHDTRKGAMAGCDLEMGGPGSCFIKPKFFPLVRKGKIPESVIDDKVRRILYVKFFLGLFDGVEKKYKGEANTKEHQDLVREIAENGIVLLKNKNDLLPLNMNNIKSIAVIGPNAIKFPVDGGGSSEVLTPYNIGPLEGLKNKCGKDIVIRYKEGSYSPSLSWVEAVASGKAPGNAEKIVIKCISENMAPGKGYSYVWFDNGSFEISSDEGKKVLETFSFEEGTSGWEKSGNASRIEVHSWHSYDGENSYGVGNDDGPENAGGFIFKKIEPGKIKKGELVTFRMWVQCERYYLGEASLKLEFLDSGDNLLTSYKSDIYSNRTKDNESMLKEAVQAAKKSDAAVIFAGFYKNLETEGADRKDMELPEGQDQLIEAVSNANKKTVVVLINGSPVDMRKWVDKVPAVVEALYPGQEGGNAIADILLGNMNPSGKLPFTFPKKLEDNPSYANYPGSGGKVHYNEDIFVGYRHYDTRNVEPLFPFGHGLSYTEFEYSNLEISPEEIKKGGTVTVSLDVENIGKREGKEVVQLYVQDVESSVERPVKELKGFRKINLKPGEKKKVRFELKEDALSFYDPAKKSWVAEPGGFKILIGSSSRDIRLKGGFSLLK